MNAISVSHLTKDFKTDFWKKTVRALHDVSFTVEPGQIFGLVGPNGAGKTTTIKILMGLIQQTTGEARIFGELTNRPEAKRSIGFLPENAYYYDYLSAMEVLDFYARLFGLRGKLKRQRIADLLELVGLTGKEDIKLRHFSKGMLQRIGIAQALVNDPKLIVFDEPMSGLDPIGRKEVRDIILNLKRQGKTVLFSSHILADVESICEQVAIIVSGKVKASGPLGDLVSPKTRSVEVHFKQAVERPPLEIPERFRLDFDLRTINDVLVFTCKKGEKIYELIDWGRKNDLQLLAVSPNRETLEELFVKKVEAENR